MNLAENLVHSRSACRHVLNVAKLRAANWDQHRGRQNWEDCLPGADVSRCAPQMNPLDRCVYQQLQRLLDDELPGNEIITQIRIIAHRARTLGCGNCAEASCLAFVFLYDRGIRPLDIVELVDNDHQFVVIGRAGGDATNFASYGADAVVCDPWMHGLRRDTEQGSYAFGLLRHRMRDLFPFTRVGSMFSAR